MRRYLLLFSFLFISIGCEKEPQDTGGKGQLDPDAMITIRGVSTRAIVGGKTPLEVVEEALAIKWQTDYAFPWHPEGTAVARGFRSDQKDYDTPALLMMGIDVITQQGEYYKSFTYAYNVVITNLQGDSIAYVPDDVINSARPLIEAAYDEGDYTEVYRLFNEAFIFIPF